MRPFADIWNTIVASENYLRWGRKKIANKSKHAVEVKVAGIQMDLRDVSYYVKRKHGFPSLSDTGVADIILAGDGFSFKLKMSTADPKDRQNFFKVDKVDVEVKNFNIKLKKSHHKLLFGLFKPIMLKVIRPALQKAVEKAIRDKINELDGLLYQIKLEADKAADEVANDPSKAQSIYSRYVTAAQNKFLHKKKKAEEFAADKKVNYAVTKEESIFPNIHLSGGISSKATEYKELARKGDRWESPVFSIGSASRSTDIPPAPKVTRKPHRTAEPNNVQQHSGFGESTYGGNSSNQAVSGIQGLSGGSGLGGHQAANGSSFNAFPNGYNAANPADYNKVNQGINPNTTHPAGANTAAPYS